MDERRLESGDRLHEDQSSSSGGRERFKPAGVRASMPQPGAARPMTEETTISPDRCLAEKTLAEIEAEIRKTLEALARAKRAHPKHGKKSLRWYLGKLYANNRSSIYT